MRDNRSNAELEFLNRQNLPTVKVETINEVQNKYITNDEATLYVSNMLRSLNGNLTQMILEIAERSNDKQTIIYSYLLTYLALNEEGLKQNSEYAEKKINFAEGDSSLPTVSKETINATFSEFLKNQNKEALNELLKKAREENPNLIQAIVTLSERSKDQAVVEMSVALTYAALDRQIGANKLELLFNKKEEN